MAQQQFNPVPDVTTHSDARTLINSNFTDAENRLSALEGSDYSLQFVQQSLTSSAGILTLDVSNGHNGVVTLTEDVDLVLSGSPQAGSDGIIIVKQDATGEWAMTSTGNTVLGGGFINVENVTANGVGACSVSWYYDGSDFYLYISDFV